MIYGLMAVIYGALMSIQSAFSAELSQCYGYWFAAVVVHFGALVALTPTLLTKWGKKQGYAPWYLYIGGAIGYFNLIFTNYGAVNLGLTNSSVLMILGQIVFATGLDSLGWFGSRKQRITPAKWGAIVIVLAGVLSISLLSGEMDAQFGLLAVAASLMRGVVLVITRQFNGQLGQRVGPGFSAYMNYATGLAASIVVFALMGCPMAASFPVPGVSIWAYICGIIGCGGLCLCNLASPKLSVLTMSLIDFLSRTITAMLIDLLWGKLSIPTIIGCGIVAIGMIINLIVEGRETASVH